jgi:hypothetical protein
MRSGIAHGRGIGRDADGPGDGATEWAVVDPRAPGPRAPDSGNPGPGNPDARAPDARAPDPGAVGRAVAAIGALAATPGGLLVV